MRALISWTAAMSGKLNSIVQPSAYPNRAPTCEYVASALGWASDAPVTNPGPSRRQRGRSFGSVVSTLWARAGSVVSLRHDTNGLGDDLFLIDAKASCADLVREVIEVPRDDVPVSVRRQIGLLVRAMLGRPGHEPGAQAKRLGGAKIAVMRRHHHHLRRLQAEDADRLQIAGRHRLVVAHHLRAENAVPGNAGTLGHVEQECHVPVRVLRDDELPLEPREARHRVGPRI